MLDTLADDPTPALPTRRDATRPDATTDPVRSRVPVGIFIGVFIFGLLHGLLFVVVLPAWAVEDEPQHVDYAYHLAHDHALPDLDGTIEPAIVRSMFTHDRWSAYDLGPTPEQSRQGLGLAAKSYLAYHPPLPYLGMAVLVPGPADEVDEVHLLVLRTLSAIAFGLASAGTALLAARLTAGIGRPAARWTPAVRRAALGAGVAMAALPVLADAGGRVNTDIFGLLAVVGALLAMLHWHEGPSRSRALLVGLTLAVAALTRETTIVLAVPTLALLIAARRARVLRADHVLRVLGPPVAAVVLWTTALWLRTGDVIGSQAFIDHFGPPFEGVGLGESLLAVPGRLLLPYGSWNLPTAVAVLAGAGLVVGLVAAARNGLAWATAIATAMLALAVAVFAIGASSGLTTLTARLLLPAFPALVAVAAAGWARRHRSTVTVTWVMVTTGFGVWFVLAGLLPRFAGAG